MVVRQIFIATRAVILLGLVGFYRRFIQDFGKIAEPLDKLLNKEVHFTWSKECESAVEQLKQALQKAPFLDYPNDTDLYTLSTEASLFGIGAIISQRQQWGERVIAYASKTLSKSQQDNSATKRKLFAIVYFTQHFTNYLLGQKALIVTNHRALKWLYSFKESDGLLARWIEKLGQFDFEIKHEAGKKIPNADCLSRVPQTEDQVKDCDRMNQINTEEKNIWSIGLGKSAEQLVEHQKNAADHIIMRNWIKNGKCPQRKHMAGASRALWKHWSDFGNLRIENDLIKRQKRIDEFNNLTQIVIQRSLLKENLPFFNEHCGRFGMAKTFYRVREQFYWPGIKKDVHEWVSSCEECCQKKSPHQKHIHRLTTWKPSHPFWQIALDIMGPLPESSGNKYILLIGDRFPKWCEAIPMSNQEASTVAKAFVNVWFSKFGCPANLHCDKGSNFISNLFQNMCKGLGINRT